MWKSSDRRYCDLRAVFRFLLRIIHIGTIDSSCHPWWLLAIPAIQDSLTCIPTASSSCLSLYNFPILSLSLFKTFREAAVFLIKPWLYLYGGIAILNEKKSSKFQKYSYCLDEVKVFICSTAMIRNVFFSFSL